MHGGYHVFGLDLLLSIEKKELWVKKKKEVKKLNRCYANESNYYYCSFITSQKNTAKYTCLQNEHIIIKDAPVCILVMSLVLFPIIFNIIPLVISSGKKQWNAEIRTGTESIHRLHSVWWGPYSTISRTVLVEWRE